MIPIEYINSLGEKREEAYRKVRLSIFNGDEGQALINSGIAIGIGIALNEIMQLEKLKKQTT